jgi:hypothetical protein
VRAKLLNLDTMLSEWNNNVFSDNEFLKNLNKFGGSTKVIVEHNDQGSLT